MDKPTTVEQFFAPSKSDYAQFFKPMPESEKQYSKGQFPRRIQPTPSLQSFKDKITFLENVLDTLYYEKLDFKELCNVYYMKVQSMELEIDNFKKTIIQVRTHSQETYDQYKSIKSELQVMTENHKHAVQNIQELNRTIQLAKDEMAKLRAAKVNDEHMARKLVELHKENTNLREQLENAIPPDDSAQIIQFKQQITRLLDEKATYNCDTINTGKQPCGQCLACQLKQTKAILAQTTENFREVNNYYESIEIEKNTSQALMLKLETELLKCQDVNSIYDLALKDIANSFWGQSFIARKAIETGHLRLKKS